MLGHGWLRDSHGRPSILVPRARHRHRSALSCFLVGRHAVVCGALEELIQQLLELQLVVEFEDAVGKSMPEQKPVQMVSADDQSPDCQPQKLYAFAGCNKKG
jgi:hypothetical protein